MRLKIIIASLMVIAILAVGVIQLASPHRGFLRKDFSYYSQLAQAFAATVERYPVGPEPCVWVPVIGCFPPSRHPRFAAH